MHKPRQAIPPSRPKVYTPEICQARGCTWPTNWPATGDLCLVCWLKERKEGPLPRKPQKGGSRRRQ